MHKEVDCLLKASSQIWCIVYNKKREIMAVVVRWFFPLVYLLQILLDFFNLSNNSHCFVRSI